MMPRDRSSAKTNESNALKTSITTPAADESSPGMQLMQVDGLVAPAQQNAIAHKCLFPLPCIALPRLRSRPQAPHPLSLPLALALALEVNFMCCTFQSCMSC